MNEDHLVCDVEIQREVGGPEGYRWEDTDKLLVAVAVVYEFRSDRFRVYGPNDVERLKARLLRADRVTTFNGWKFDMPVIWGLPGRERVKEMEGKSDDLLARIWSAMGLGIDRFSDAHKGWNLDTVVRWTLHREIGKIGKGSEAPKWFQAGDWARVVSYCADDVALERDLCIFIDKHGYACNGTRQVFIPPWNSKTGLRGESIDLSGQGKLAL